MIMNSKNRLKLTLMAIGNFLVLGYFYYDYQLPQQGMYIPLLPMFYTFIFSCITIVMVLKNISNWFVPGQRLFSTIFLIALFAGIAMHVYFIRYSFG
jgi:hypothetical protein